jgi:hypothetical protein
MYYLFIYLFCMIIFVFIEGPHSRSYGRTAALKAYCATLWWRWRERWSVFFSSNGALVEWNWQGKTEVLGEKPIPVPLCPPQIPHGPTRILCGYVLCILRWILKESVRRAWTEFIWLRTGTSGRLLWIQERTFGFHKIRRISCLAEELLASWN